MSPWQPRAQGCSERERERESEGGERERERAGSAGDTEAGRGPRLRDTETRRDRLKQRCSNRERRVGWGVEGDTETRSPQRPIETHRYTETQRKRQRGNGGGREGEVDARAGRHPEAQRFTETP